MVHGPQRTLALGVVLVGVGDGAAAELWRHPDVPLDASIDIDWYIAHAEAAERAGFDFVFIVDSQYIDPTFPPHHLNRLEPLTLLSAVAARTSRIGLVATVSTTYSEPWDIARRLASLDVISGGRAGWNIVTSMDPGTAGNFGREHHGDHDSRYARASEAVGVVRALWDSYEDDAFATRKDAEHFLVAAKQHRLDHVGDHFRVSGPLNIQRSVQGAPVLFQAGTSIQGRALSAEVADIVFSFARTTSEAGELARDIREGAAAIGRDPRSIRFIPALTVTMADTSESARALVDAKRSASDVTHALDQLSRAFGGRDFQGAELDAPLADILGEARPGSVSTFRAQISDALRQGATLREFLTRDLDHWAHFVGSPHDVADEIERWFESGHVDGFNLFVHEPEQHDRFLSEVVPILVARGIHRDAAESTLRGRLGLPVPVNRHAVRSSEHVDA